MSPYYPVNLFLQSKCCVVVGGGQVAERKIRSLLEASAQVVTVSPEPSDSIIQWADSGRLECRRKAYDRYDLSGAFLVFAATDRKSVNEQVYRDALDLGLLCNVVDAPDLSGFIDPAVIRRGKLLLTVSTSGASPAAAASIKRDLEEQFGEEYEIYLDFLSELRAKVKSKVIDTKQRQQFFRKVLEDDILEKIRSGTFENYREQLLRQF